MAERERKSEEGGRKGAKGERRKKNSEIRREVKEEKFARTKPAPLLGGREKQVGGWGRRGRGGKGRGISLPPCHPSLLYMLLRSYIFNVKVCFA